MRAAYICAILTQMNSIRYSTGRKSSRTNWVLMDYAGLNFTLYLSGHCFVICIFLIQILDTWQDSGLHRHF